MIACLCLVHPLNLLLAGREPFLFCSVSLGDDKLPEKVSPADTDSCMGQVCPRNVPNATCSMTYHMPNLTSYVANIADVKSCQHAPHEAITNQYHFEQDQCTTRK